MAWSRIASHVKRPLSNARRTLPGPASAEGLARIVAARTVHGGHGVEMRTFRALVREMRQHTRRLQAEKF